MRTATQSSAVLARDPRWSSYFLPPPRPCYEASQRQRGAIAGKLYYPDWESLLAVHAVSLYGNPEQRRQWQALIGREGVVRDDGASVSPQAKRFTW